MIRLNAMLDRCLGSIAFNGRVNKLSMNGMRISVSIYTGRIDMTINETGLVTISKLMPLVESNTTSYNTNISGQVEGIKQIDQTDKRRFEWVFLDGPGKNIPPDIMEADSNEFICRSESLRNYVIISPVVRNTQCLIYFNLNEEEDTRKMEQWFRENP